GDPLLGHGEGIRVGNEVIPVHVVAGGDPGGGIATRLEGVAGVLRDPAVVDITDGIQHRAPVLVEVYPISHGVADYAQADALCLHGRRVRLVVIAFDRAIVHEIELD